MSRMPSLFISHGSPELALRETPAHQFLAGYGAALPRPKAIVVVTAHWETSDAAVNTGSAPATIYDFGGFDPRLRTIRYTAPGAPDLAEQAARLIEASGLDVVRDATNGWDHGVWVPLHLMYPAADIPVVQVAIQPHRSPAYHHGIGHALAALRDDGVLLIGSGALTHNLRAFRGQPVDAPVPVWVAEFRDWMTVRLEAGDHTALTDYRRQAPSAIENHPEDEHLLPLYAPLGATAPDETIRRVHASVEHGVIAMDVFQFG